MKSDIFSSGLLNQIRWLDMFTVLFMICGLATRTLSKTCVSVNCSPGFQIITCGKDGEHDSCEPCPQDRLQPFNISSMDDKIFHSCFSIDPNRCTEAGVIHSRWRDDSSCKQRCECDVANCYAGKTACACQKYEPCGINQQMNRTNGACEPCPPNKYKSERGCYPCQYDLSGTRTQFAPQKQTIPPFPEINKTMRDTDRSSTSTRDTSSVSPQPNMSSPNATTKEMLKADDAFCFNIYVVIILGTVLFLMSLLVVALLIKWFRFRRASRFSHFSSDTEENKPNSITLTQENALLLTLNIKDTNTNIARDLDTVYQCTEGIEHSTNSQDDQVVELDAKKVATEAPDTGYWTQHGCSASSYPTSYQTNSYPTQNGGISGPCENLSCLLTETSSPTEHDEESTHVKSISVGD